MQSQPPPGYQPPGHPPSGYPPPGYPPQQPKKGMPTWVVILIVLGGVMFFVMGPMAVLAIYGVRKYIANAKTAEARNVLGQLAKDSVAAFEGSGPAHRVCPSASRPVPASAARIRGTKYQSSEAEWNVDAPRRAGFACLQFEMNQPQYFQYVYRGGAGLPGNGFSAEAHGDLDGDGQLSTYRLMGQLDATGDLLLVAPTLEEIDPQE